MKNRCFVIGPMNKQHINNLRWLAYDVVAKILEHDNFEVLTPDRIGTGNIMHNIIKSCDRAQLVVADTTGNNPNVLYEMAVADAMGRACIPVKIRSSKSIKNKKDPMPFDRSQYKFYEIEVFETEKAIKELDTVVHDVLKAQQKGDIFENPLTDYFGVPLICFSSSYGIARTYYLNFVLPCFKGELLEGPNYVMNVLKEKRIKEEEIALKVESLIPDELEKATRQEVGKLVAEKIFNEVTIKAAGRVINAYVWPEERVKTEMRDGSSLTIVDIPTALSSLREIAVARLGKNEDPDSSPDDFQEIQYDEISQFKRYLQRFAKSGIDSSLFRKDDFKILDIKETSILERVQKNEINS